MHKHSVESNKRATRRHHAESLKKRYKKYSRFDHLTSLNERPSDKALGKVLQCPKNCSCMMCCNDRRNPYAKAERQTLKERASVDAMEDGIMYYESYHDDPEYDA